MKVLLIFLIVLGIVGCSPNNMEEVINKHNDIQNLEGINRFVENVKNQKEAKINYVQYGIEGQRGVTTLTFNGKDIHVSNSVDGKFIGKFNCKNMVFKTEAFKKYILTNCTNVDGDHELLSFPNK
ncbi:DUF4362 domain-containing protein [Neobacillus terrae]|uniref:DUF4362 domain-containing protein n=1 Tax=Neobacillus terrae TaxID=3034837 RepID=UPI0014078D55|nr:DUF4362 domain-containing protein [Neobacillus terrae]NHM30895.1 DUF4362 domain-containing protein [Neobacillus terrae]